MSKTSSQPNNNNLVPRPPVVVVMGHIDHGKTKLLDYIRKTNLVEEEAGGITQHIGAYEVACQETDAEKSPRESASGQPESALPERKKITFIDTPGHEAFSKMRSRGAKVADVAVLVVAADEGVKPQTVEAIKTIKEANIPLVVAINKIDKSEANLENVKKELSQHEIFIEEWGGKVPAVNISAKTGQNINELLETILLMAEMEELKAKPEAPAEGVVIESHLDEKRGIVATLLIQNGSLKMGMFVVSGKALAPVRIFEDFLGKKIKTASFSSPVRVTGFNQLPQVGEKFYSFDSKKQAEEFIKELPENEGPPMSDLPGRTSEVKIPEEKAILPLVLKADTAGSLEALRGRLENFKKENLILEIISQGVGNISENDVKMASSAAEEPVIIGFNVTTDRKAKELADNFGVSLKIFEIIYNIDEWLEQEADKRTPAKQEVIGRAKLLKIFLSEKTRQIIGGKIIAGKIAKGARVRIWRNSRPIFEGKIVSLEHNKAKTEEVEEPSEFGALIQAVGSLSPGDELEIIKISPLTRLSESLVKEE